MADREYQTFSVSQERLTVSQQRGKPITHKPVHILFVILNAVLLIAVFIFNSGKSLDAVGDLFVSSTGNQSRKYQIGITPAGWTFTIWGFIYAWQAAWVLYSVVNLFRRAPGGEGPVYLSPPILPLVLYPVYMCVSCGNIGWLFLWDRAAILSSVMVIFTQPLGVWICAALSYRSLDKSCPELVRQGRIKDIWLSRALVHNGLAMYATWTAVASCLSLGMGLVHTPGSDISKSTAALVALGLLSAELVIFVASDLFLLDRYSRYTLTPYAVHVVGLTGAVSKNWSAGETNSIFLAVMLGVAGAAAVLKIILTVYRHVTRERYPGGSSSVTSTLYQENAGRAK